MRGPLIALSFVAFAVAWLVLFGAGGRQADWDAALLFLGATAFFYWMFRSGQTPPRLPTWLAAALWALPAYALIQLVPLPPSILDILSPARAAVTGSVAGLIPNVTTAPIAIVPSAALFGLVSLLGCLTVFSLMRDMEWRFVVTRPWLPVLPLVVIAAIEALIGVGQWLSRAQALPVRGTLSTSEYFAGLLEIALPFTLVFGFISLRRHQAQEKASSVPAVRTAVAWFIAVLILIALFHTTSQTSHTVVFASLFVLLAFALIPRLKTRNLRLGGAGAAAAIAISTILIVISPSDIAGSLAQIGANDQETPEARSVLWSGASSLLGEYHWFGTGMGGFESTFLKYQGSTDLNRIQHPHNDVLALLIAFGIVGFCIVLVVLVGILRPAIMGAIYQVDEGRRLLAASMVAALFGMLLRSGLEAGLSMPAIAMAFAWVAGMSQSTGSD